MKTMKLNPVFAINNSKGFRAAQKLASKKLNDIPDSIIEPIISTPEWDAYVDFIIADTYAMFCESVVA